MATQITADELMSVAALARLELSEEEKTAYSEQINHVLGYIDMIAQVDTNDIPITSQVTGLENIVRESDLVGTRSFSAQEALENARERSGNRFEVPLILPGSEE